MADNKILILTGEKQTGKTTALLKYVPQLHNVVAVLTPLVDDKRIFYLLPDGEQITMEAGDDETNVYNIGKYKFLVDGFEKVEQLLTNSLLQNKIDPIDPDSYRDRWIVIDEIGPLEMVQKKGFYNFLLQLLQQQTNYNLLLTVRPSLVDEVQLLLAIKNKKAQVITIEQLLANI